MRKLHMLVLEGCVAKLVVGSNSGIPRKSKMDERSGQHTQARQKIQKRFHMHISLKDSVTRFLLQYSDNAIRAISNYFEISLEYWQFKRNRPGGKLTITV